MKDVARLAHVSVQTVSAVVNSKPGITSSTRTRVREAIEQVGYRPFSVARSLRTRKTRTVALIVSDIANPSFATMASAAEDRAHAADYSVVVYNTHDDIEREANYLRTATERWVDGVLFVAARDQMVNLSTLQEAGIPYVAVDRIPDNYEGPSVTLNNVEAGRMAAEHLLELGHTRIAHISGPLELRLARERRDGFCEAVAKRRLPHDLNAKGEGWECSCGYKAMQWLLRHEPRPTAVFAANDRMAIGAMHAAYEAGLRIPEDLSVVGVDNIEVAAFQTPPLTTVEQDFVTISTIGVEMLLELLAGRDPEQNRILLEPNLMTTDRLLRQERSEVIATGALHRNMTLSIA
jgi:LacI family transcriptional regulator